MDRLSEISHKADVKYGHSYNKVFSFLNASGSSGATTTALMVAEALTIAKKRVALVDCDFTFSSGYEALEPQLKHITLEEDPQSRSLFGFFHEGKSILNSCYKMVNEDIDLFALYKPDPFYASEFVDEAMMAILIDELKGNYDAVILDVPFNPYLFSSVTPVLRADMTFCVTNFFQKGAGDILRVMNYFSNIHPYIESMKNTIINLSEPNEFYPKRESLINESISVYQIDFDRCFDLIMENNIEPESYIFGLEGRAVIPVEIQEQFLKIIDNMKILNEQEKQLVFESDIDE
ncbi:AAA family ATPase [Bacillus velezensis]|uniref:AAA family ATPase n=1 Tax=Bacillus amyloliquefaciens group TaxID=1938374 RepID=UPI002DBFDC13|nr:AAA family ATPase [Bacillus velezensis]MEC0385641.1 AAA family ATPase [Bacillus velezensis]MEC0388783.1 AAA family ATPase [Bacillus velezensis]